MREVLVGFDSAWTDNLRNPGAVAGLVLEEGRPVAFHAPGLATFGQARTFVDEIGAGAELLLVAIDQPTVVPNLEGFRPVERVAASVVGRLKGGVQPGRRGGGGAAMFGDDAPIWRFLDAIAVEQDPVWSRDATGGRFAIEVYPALALPSLVPALWARGRGAKYNPVVRRNFLLSDWHLVCDGLADAAVRHGLPALADWARGQREVATPKKADQDRLDAALCVLIAWHWRHAAPEQAVVLGDLVHGYIVTPVTPETRLILETAARRVGVPIDGPGCATRPEPTRTDPGRLAIPEPARPASSAPERVDAAALRALLIEVAGRGASMSYREVAAVFEYRFHQGFVASLRKALGQVSRDAIGRGEPQLMSLVVNQETRRPGQGFYDLIGRSDADAAMQMALFEAELERCRMYDWSAG